MVEPLVAFSLAEPLPLLNEWQRMHWAARKRRQRDIAWEVRANVPTGLSPIERCLIIVVRRNCPPLPDLDGLAGSAKPLLDCLVLPSRRNPNGLGIIVDDNPKCLGMLLMLPRVRQSGQMGTHVRIFRDDQDSLDYLADQMRHHVYFTRGL